MPQEITYHCHTITADISTVVVPLSVYQYCTSPTLRLPDSVSRQQSRRFSRLHVINTASSFPTSTRIASTNSIATTTPLVSIVCETPRGDRQGAVLFNMEKLCLLLFLVTVSAVIAVDDVNRTAIVHLQTATVQGNVTFQQIGNGPVRITGIITGLENGKHGFHIHQLGDTVPCGAAGSHYNPLNKNHGAPSATERHVGDLGNIESSDRKAVIDFEDNIISLIGEYSIVGRSLVIHENADDLGNTTDPQSKTTGNAGGRVACGVIGIKDPVNIWPRGTSASSTLSALSVGVVSVIAALLSTF